MESSRASHNLRATDIAAGIALVAGLAMVYVFQNVDYFAGLTGMNNHANLAFAFNRTLRLVVNDSLCMGLIYLLFRDRKFVRLGFKVFLLELFIILPAYLIIKLELEGPSEISSPLLSPVHRMIVNPLLMIILIIGLWLQRRSQS